MQRVFELLAGSALVLSQVDQDVSGMRKTICDTCPKRGEDNVCKVCKCFLSAKQKAQENRNPKRLRNEITHCPLGNWNDKETANEYRLLDGLPLLV